MEEFKTYNFDYWFTKRKVIWKNIQLPGEGASMIDAWEAHSQLYRMLNTADAMYSDICKEEVICRRNKTATTRHAKLVKNFEDTVSTLEDLTIQYRLMYPL